MAIEGITLYRTDWSWDSLLVNQTTQKFNSSKNLQHQQIHTFFRIGNSGGQRGRKSINFSFFPLLKHLKIILNASEISLNNLLSKVLSTKGWHSSCLFHNSPKISSIVPHPSTACVSAKPQLWICKTFQKSVLLACCFHYHAPVPALTWPGLWDLVRLWQLDAKQLRREWKIKQ